jgi:hypothetical protein
MADLSTDYGRTTRIVVSGYDRMRVHNASLVRGEQRVLVVSIKGATPKDRKIVTARWQCDYSSVLVMSNAKISDDGRETAIDLLAAWLGSGILKVTMTLDNGEVFVQLASVAVADGYWFTDGASVSGPNDLTATA